MGALGAAVRARDGRGPHTAFEQLVPAHFGLTRPDAVTRAIYDGRIPEERVLELAPLVFRAAGEGDAVARKLLNTLADELATMAVAMIRRVGLARRPFDVVLAGGVFQNHDDEFLARLGAAVRVVAPQARLAPLHSPPLVGAALLGLDRIGPGVSRAAEARLREACAAMGTPPRI
jgi:N-acetylglucosamine kinase-like BadF-type ATPase